MHVVVSSLCRHRLGWGLMCLVLTATLQGGTAYLHYIAGAWRAKECVQGDMAKMTKPDRSSTAHAFSFA